MGLLARGSLIRKQVIIMGGDAGVALVSLSLLDPLSRGVVRLPAGGVVWSAVYVAVVLLSAYLCEVYRPGRWDYKERFIRSSIAVAISFVVLVNLRFTGLPLSLVVILFSLGLFLVGQNCWQSLFQKTNDSRFFSENVLIIGTGATALKAASLVERFPGRYTLSGYVRTPTDPVSVKESEIAGSIEEIIEVAKEVNAHAIVIALTEKRGNLIIGKLVTCKLMGVRILDYPTFYETLAGKIPVEDINPSWLVQSSGFLITPSTRIIKRGIDIGLSLALLIVVLPLFPLIIIGVKYRSPGPVFYFQKRVGVNGKLFTIYKFRTMRVDAESVSGVAWAAKNDSRITPCGHFLRRTRVDELPQLVNVLKGDMSFIGPRPERPEFVEQIASVTPYYMERHAVKPGITGWAQVMYPYGSSLGDSVEKLRYDLYYINNLSLFLELLIILETVKVVLFRRGGR